MSSCAEVFLKPGEILYHEGDHNNCGYVIESGEVVLYTFQADRKVMIERRGAGAIIGELSILTGQPRTVTVQATQACRIFEVPAQQIIERFERLDPVLRACVETSISFAAALKDKATSDLTTCANVPLSDKVLRDAEDVIDGLRIEAGLSEARCKNELHMVYQPIVRVHDEITVGAEALIRWRHPTLGDVSPAQFVAVAETTGKVRDLTEFAVSQACADLSKLRASGVGDNFFFSVNASSDDIIRRSFVDYVAFSLDRYELPAASLKLEVTETALIGNVPAAKENLHLLREIGCGVSLDDFGSGYSNFAHLHTFPFTTMKIDRGFIADLHQSNCAQKIVRSLIDLGQTLQMDVIAEGLECSEELGALRHLNCTFAQGFFFHRPLQLSALKEVLKTQRNQIRDSA